jgi:hypothetical protein
LFAAVESAVAAVLAIGGAFAVGSSGLVRVQPEPSVGQTHSNAIWGCRQKPTVS